MPAEPCRHLTSALNDSMKTAIILFGNNTYYVIMLLLMLKIFWSQYKCIKETNYVLDNIIGPVQRQRCSFESCIHLIYWTGHESPAQACSQAEVHLVSFLVSLLLGCKSGARPPAPATALLKKLCVGREQIFLQLAALIECRPVQGGPRPGHLYLTYF